MAATRRLPLPAAVYRLVNKTPGAVLLEGGSPQNPNSTEEPWTRLFTAPVRICAACDAAQLPGLFAEIESAVAAGLSAAGFFTYECGACFEPKAAMHPPRAGTPLAWFGIYERAFVFDHQRGEFPQAVPPELDAFGRDGAAGTTEASEGRSFSRPFSAAGLAPAFALDQPEYARRIAAIHEWIRAGDVYQLNFTAPLRLPAEEDTAAWYARVRERQPARYGAFLHWQPGRRILSFSPELFFRIDADGEARRIVSRPMKGTAPRGRTLREDRALAEWLRNDAKNRSENLMIADLLRNDLGRLARFGSVRAEKLFAVERLPTLWQMTSTIAAELRPGVGFSDVFRALFPCGSVTGAPKVRAMQLIAALEDGPRGVYTGAIGFFSPRQTVFNVAIRTLELDGAHAAMGVGSGIVIDSDAAAEYRECLLKAEFLTRSPREQPEEFSLIETMLWDGAFPLLELHLDRLADSAEYFGIPCDRAAVKAALEEHAREFAGAAPRRVRLLLAAGGGVQIAGEPLLAGPAACSQEGTACPPGQAHPQRASEPKQQPLRVRIAPGRTDPADPMLYHKTTHRPLYGPAFEQAQREGFADLLFFNLRGELTEGAISNVFIEKDGRWFTPPVECGLLAGVFRRFLLETRPDIEEKILYESDLRNADAVYIANAVRGLRPAKIEWFGDQLPPSF